MTTTNREVIEAEFLENIAKLLNNVGDQAECKGCSARIWWVVHKNGKKAPYTERGLNHFVDCPEAEKFRTGKKSST